MSTVIKTLEEKKSKILIKVNWNDKYPVDHGNDIVTVQLFKNGSKEGEVVELNKDNHWQFTWENIEMNKYYELAEFGMNIGYDSDLIYREDDASDEYVYQITKTQHLGSISLSKTDVETNKGIQGAVIEIYDINKHKVKELVTDINGKVFTDLPIGKYTLCEVCHNSFNKQIGIIIEKDSILQKNI